MTTTDTNWTWSGPWWGTLVALNLIHLILGVILFVRSRRRGAPADTRYLKWMGSLGLVFVCVAFYRSIFVSSYLRQLAWFDSVLNSSLLIRCFATFAELSFTGLIASSLLRMNRDVPELIDPGKRFSTFLQTRMPVFLFACIFIANIFATTATITKIHLLFALEETFWGIGFIALLPMLFISIRKLSAFRNTDRWQALRPFRTLTWVVVVFAIGYSLFEWGFNLPVVYWPEAIAQLRMAVPEPAFRFGWDAIRDAFLVVHPTRDLAAWGGMGFVVWHSGYFSICVWMVLFMMTGPRLREGKV